MADYHLHKQEPDKAINSLRGILKNDYGDLESRNKLCQALRQTGKNDEADTEAELLTKLRDIRKQWSKLHKEALGDSNNAELRYKLGELAVKLKYRDLALNWFKAALTIDPKHTGARDAINQMMSQVEG